MKVAVTGASQNREKFGNEAVCAYVEHGDTVCPVNPNYAGIEGLPAHKSVLDIPGNLDLITPYLPPEPTLTILDDIVKKK